MDINTKKMKILQMIEQKKITVEEGMMLLDKLAQEEQESSSNYPHHAEVIAISDSDYEIIPAEKQVSPSKSKSLFGKNSFFGNLGRGSKKIVIRVEENGKSQVNLRIPLGFAKFFLKSGITIGNAKAKKYSYNKQFVGESNFEDDSDLKYLRFIDEAQLDEFLANNDSGPIVDIFDEDDNTRVYIGIE